VSRCSSCGAEIVWLKTTAGKSMPCDPTPIAIVPGSGSARVVTDEGEVISGRLADPLFPDEGVKHGRVSHFSTCAFAASHRKAKR